MNYKFIRGFWTALNISAWSELRFMRFGRLLLCAWNLKKKLAPLSVDLWIIIIFNLDFALKLQIVWTKIQYKFYFQKKRLPNNIFKPEYFNLYRHRKLRKCYFLSKIRPPLSHHHQSSLFCNSGPPIKVIFVEQNDS